MSLLDPGTHQSVVFPGSSPPGARTLRSDISVSHPSSLDPVPADGIGDFTLKIVFDQFAIPKNQFVLLAISIGNNGETFAMSVFNSNARQAALVGGISGPGVGFSHNTAYPGPSEWSYIIDFFEVDVEAFQSSTLAGDLTLTIAFNDTTNTFTGSYSIDGGPSGSLGSFATAQTGWSGFVQVQADPRDSVESVPALTPTGLAILVSMLLAILGSAWRLAPGA